MAIHNVHFAPGRVLLILDATGHFPSCRIIYGHQDQHTGIDIRSICAWQQSSRKVLRLVREGCASSRDEDETIYRYTFWWGQTRHCAGFTQNSASTVAGLQAPSGRQIHAPPAKVLATSGNIFSVLTGGICYLMPDQVGGTRCRWMGPG